MAYQFPLNGGRLNASIGGNSTSAGAGYSLVSTGTLHLMGGNNVTLSQNANSVTISAANAAAASIKFSAGASSASLSAVTFSDSNGVSFGLNGSTLTGSVATTYAASNHSHGNPTLNLTNITGTTASNSGGLTLSLSANPAQTNQIMTMYASGGNTTQASTGTMDAQSVRFRGEGIVSAGITGSSVVISATQSNQALSASNGSFAFQTAGFSNANGVTFGTSAGSIMTASVETSYAVSNHSHGNPTLSLTNLSGTTGSASNGLTLSLSAASQTVQTQNLHNLTLAGNSTSAGGGYVQVSSGTLTLAGGNNITLSQNGNAITISGAAGGGGGGIALANSQTTYTSGTANMVVVGGAMTIASTTGQSFNFSVPAQSSLSETGIISISRNGSTISIGAPAFSAGMSTLGNTSGTTGTVSNQLILAGGNNITLSQSTGAGGNTISISAPNQSVQSQNLVSVLGSTGNISFGNANRITFGANASTVTASVDLINIGVSSMGNTAGSTGTIDGGQYVFVGGNNITLSQSTGAGNWGTVTIIGGAGGGGGGIALANSQTTYSTGTAGLLEGSGAITIGSNTGQQFNITVPQVSSLSATGAVSIATNGNTISIGAPTVPTLSRWEYPEGIFTSIANGTVAQGSLSIQHMYVPFGVTGASMKIGGSVNVGTFTSATTATITANLWMGIYTLSGSTLSLASSGSANNSMTVATNVALTSYNGIRQLTVPINVNMTPGEYWVGALMSTATNFASATMAMNLYGGNANIANTASNAILSPLGVNMTISARDALLFQGIYTASTTALPSAINNTQINNLAASNVARAAFYNVIYNATY